MGRHLVFYLVFAAMVHYLVGRAVATQRWYLRQFEDYPPRRRAIVPGLL